MVTWTRLNITLVLHKLSVLLPYQISGRTVCDMWRLLSRRANFLARFIFLKISWDFFKMRSFKGKNIFTEMKHIGLVI